MLGFQGMDVVGMLMVNNLFEGQVLEAMVAAVFVLDVRRMIRGLLQPWNA